MMQKQDLYEYLSHLDMLDAETLKEWDEILREFPYFQTIDLLKLKNLHSLQHPNFEEQLTRIAIFCTDRKQLFYLINDQQFGRFIDHQTAPTATDLQTDRTRNLIDSFLDTYADAADSYSDSIAEPEANLASTDYLAYLTAVEHKNLDSDESNPLQHQQIIDNFLEKADSNTIFRSFPENDDESQNKSIQNADNEWIEDEFLTETLAKIYIKQKKYEQALAIIQRLSLNFPKKSTYFADQIRFLELLIFNEKNKKQS